MPGTNNAQRSATELNAQMVIRVAELSAAVHLAVACLRTGRTQEALDTLKRVEHP